MSVQGKLGFGFMRLPMHDNEVDYEETSKMVDLFIENGFNYFDTAHGYLNGLSEVAIKKCLTSRYPRDKYILTDKLSFNYFESQEDIRPLFDKQLEACGVDYFDYYLMHSQNKALFDKYKKCRAYETAMELRQEGRINHLGISFHDTAEMLEQILTEYPQIEVVQLQFNYVDFEDGAVQSRKCYEVCVKHGKPVIVMEPVKGGNLATLPPQAGEILAALKGGSNASYAIRFAAGFENVMMVLSGMGSVDMVRDNTSYMKEFKPLDVNEVNAIARVSAIIRGLDLVQCTACHYCTKDCPKSIPIPELFACLNASNTFHTWNANFYSKVHTTSKGKASDCIKCGRCEQACPQHLPIRSLLEKVSATFEKKG